MNFYKLKYYQMICFSYERCFGWLYPELEFFSTDKEFEVRGVHYNYMDITDTYFLPDYFIIEIKSESYLYLPLQDKAEFKILNKNIMKQAQMN